MDVSLSIMTQMKLYPSGDGGNSPIKSIPMDSHGCDGMGSEWSSPAGRCVLGLTA